MTDLDAIIVDTEEVEVPEAFQSFAGGDLDPAIIIDTILSDNNTLVRMLRHLVIRPGDQNWIAF